MQRPNTLIILIPIILLGFGLRLFQLDVVPLRGDEAFSAINWAELPLSQSLTNIATFEPHPPLTYIFFHVWGLIFGIRPEFIVRMMPVIANVLGIPAMFALGYRLFNHQVGLLGAFLWAIHPFEIWHSQDFRNYSVWASLSVVSLWLGIRLVLNERRWIDWILYGGLSLITSLVFYMELVFIGTLGLFVLGHWLWDRKHHSSRFVIKFLGLQAGIIGITLLAFVTFQRLLLQPTGYGGNVAQFDALRLLTDFVPILNFGETLPYQWNQVLWIGLFLFFVGPWLNVYRRTPQHAIFLLMLIAVPMVMLSIISTRVEIFAPRYIIASVPAFILLFSASVVILSSMVKSPQTRRGFVVAIIAIWTGLSAYSLSEYFFNPFHVKAQDWKSLTDYLEANVGVNDLVIQASTDPSFGYYYDGLADDIGLPYNHLETEANIIAQLEDANDNYESIWLVANAPHEWDNGTTAPNWLSANLQLVRETNIPNLPIRQFRTWEVNDIEYDDTALATFEDLIELVGIDIAPTIDPTGEQMLLLYFEPLAQSEMNLKLFVHLIGDINPETNTPLWSQHDQFPQSGRIQSTTWTIGEVYREWIELPLDKVTAGTYTIHVGFYNPETGDRWFTVEGIDHVVIGEYTVR